MSQLLSRHNYYLKNQFRPYLLSPPVLPLNFYSQPYPQAPPYCYAVSYPQPIVYELNKRSSATNLNIILIAILILASLDLIFVRPYKIQAKLSPVDKTDQLYSPESDQ